MDEKIAAHLREPFPPELIGKRPQPTCRDCGRSPSKVCENHRKRECPECGQYMTTAHMHLDFVGHADVTDRFLKVDPDWTWEPLALDERGLPVFDQHGGMWIRLTVAGVTRIGYGDAAGKTGPNAVKEAIGDALRNAGMRFGVGLDMWRKEVADSDPEPQRPSPPPQPPAEQHTDHEWLADIEQRIAAAAQEQELVTLANEVRAKKLAGRCEDVHAAHLFAIGAKREQELAAEGQSAPADSPPPAARPEPQQPPAAADGGAAGGYEARIKSARNADEIAAIRREVMDDFRKQKLDPTTGNKLLRAITSREYELAEAA